MLKSLILEDIGVVYNIYLFIVGRKEDAIISSLVVLHRGTPSSMQN